MRDAKIMESNEGRSQIHGLVIARETVQHRQPQRAASPRRVAA
jgi:alkylation response protein AidB-like acyl-CoA dehydrogenase